jgi:hypothetical protein
VSASGQLRQHALQARPEVFSFLDTKIRMGKRTVLICWIQTRSPPMEPPSQRSTDWPSRLHRLHGPRRIGEPLKSGYISLLILAGSRAPPTNLLWRLALPEASHVHLVHQAIQSHRHDPGYGYERRQLLRSEEGGVGAT